MTVQAVQPVFGHQGHLTRLNIITGNSPNTHMVTACLVWLANRLASCYKLNDDHGESFENVG